LTYSCVFYLQGPDGNPRNVKVVENGDGTFKASYIPDDCGRYVINVSYAGQLLNRNLGSQASVVGEVS